ncbi:hypothetical protein GWI33_016973 [Rhynchophorus ferrugineus]|uniref:Uncharacterized protein n=1 Tax=Rhynchophorus ferrugineus TaxID=354439 RepID=A0A834M6M7_RHYFE|nr:hypothetical protein GWI33_016973 [Rhynchophorus ferrugineus]
MYVCRKIVELTSLTEDARIEKLPYCVLEGKKAQRGAQRALGHEAGRWTGKRGGRRHDDQTKKAFGIKQPPLAPPKRGSSHPDRPAADVEVVELKRSNILIVYKLPSNPRKSASVTNRKPATPAYNPN